MTVLTTVEELKAAPAGTHVTAPGLRWSYVRCPADEAGGEWWTERGGWVSSESLAMRGAWTVIAHPIPVDDRMISG